MNAIDEYKKIQELQMKIKSYDLYDAITRLDNRVERNLKKLLELNKNPEALTNKSSAEISKFLDKAYRELELVWKSAHTAFPIYVTLCEHVMSQSNKEPEEKASEK